jgi:hypothetical protein
MEQRPSSEGFEWFSVIRAWDRKKNEALVRDEDR